LTFLKSEKKITKASKKSLKVYKIYYFGAEFGTGYLIDLGIWAAKKDYETCLSWPITQYLPLPTTSTQSINKQISFICGKPVDNL
jgi:hypothetical protein